MSRRFLLTTMVVIGLFGMVGCCSEDLPPAGNCNCSTCYVTINYQAGYTNFKGYRTVRITDYDNGAKYIDTTTVNAPGVTWPVPSTETFKVTCCKRLKVEVFFGDPCPPSSFGVGSVYSSSEVFSPQACTTIIYPLLAFYYSEC